MKRNKGVRPAPFRPCGTCARGFLVERRPEASVAVRCPCWRQWKQAQLEQTAGGDGKEKSVGK